MQSTGFCTGTGSSPDTTTPLCAIYNSLRVILLSSRLPYHFCHETGRLRRGVARGGRQIGVEYGDSPRKLCRGAALVARFINRFAH